MNPQRENDPELKTKSCLICRGNKFLTDESDDNESDIETDSGSSYYCSSDGEKSDLTEFVFMRYRPNPPKQKQRYSLRSSETESTAIQVTNPKPSTDCLNGSLIRFYFLRDFVGYPNDKIKDVLETVGSLDGFNLCEYCLMEIKERKQNEETIKQIQKRQSDIDQRIRNKVMENLCSDYSTNATAAQCNNLESDILHYIFNGGCSEENVETKNIETSSAGGSRSVETQTEAANKNRGNLSNFLAPPNKEFKYVDDKDDEETSFQASGTPPAESPRTGIVEFVESDCSSVWGAAPSLDFYGDGGSQKNFSGYTPKKHDGLFKKPLPTVLESSSSALRRNINWSAGINPVQNKISELRRELNRNAKPATEDILLTGRSRMRTRSSACLEKDNSHQATLQKLSQTQTSNGDLVSPVVLIAKSSREDERVTHQVFPSSSLTVRKPRGLSTYVLSNDDDKRNEMELENIFILDDTEQAMCDPPQEQEDISIDHAPSSNQTSGAIGNKPDDDSYPEVVFESNKIDNWYTLDHLLDTGLRVVVPQAHYCKIQYPVTPEMIAKAPIKSCNYRFEKFREDFGEVDSTSGRYRYECPISGEKVFRRSEYLMAHLLKCHFNQYPWNCPMCSYKSITANSFRLHLIQHYDEDIFAQLRTTNKYFLPLSRVPLPMLKENAETNAGLSTWLSVEEILDCGRSFLNMSVAYPLTDRCMEKAAKQSCHVGVRDSYGVDAQGLYVCPFKRKQSTGNYLREEFLKAHILSVHYLEIEPWQCDICRQTFSDVASLRRHLFEKHGPIEKYSCVNCPRHFGSKGSLNNHVVYAHKPKTNIKCDMCQQVFAQLTTFIGHLHQSHPEFELDKGDPNVRKSVVCNACPSEFKWWTDLHFHQVMTHQGEERNGEFINCDFCSTEEFQSCHRNLERHMEIKHPPAAFKCNQCFASFKFEAQMNAHVKRHGPAVVGSWSSKPWEGD